jgi:hypothetical protein
MDIEIVDRATGKRRLLFGAAKGYEPDGRGGFRRRRSAEGRRPMNEHEIGARIDTLAGLIRNRPREPTDAELAAAIVAGLDLLKGVLIDLHRIAEAQERQSAANVRFADAQDVHFDSERREDP